MGKLPRDLLSDAYLQMLNGLPSEPAAFEDATGKIFGALEATANDTDPEVRALRINIMKMLELNAINDMDRRTLAALVLWWRDRLHDGESLPAHVTVFAIETLAAAVIAAEGDERARRSSIGKALGLNGREPQSVAHRDAVVEVFKAHYQYRHTKPNIMQKAMGAVDGYKRDTLMRLVKKHAPFALQALIATTKHHERRYYEELLKQYQ